jgi:hypothetical protein
VDPVTMMLIQAGIGGASSFLNSSAEKYINRAQNSVRRAEADAQNRVRDASNGFNLAVFERNVQMQALANKRRSQDLGDALTATATNVARQKDLALRGSFEDNLKEAEEYGAQAAAAAAAGVGGDAVDVISGTTRLRQARAFEDAERAREQGDVDYAAARGNLVLQAMSGLDAQSIFADFDYGINVAEQKAGPNRFMSVLDGTLKSGGLQAAAGAYGEYFGTKPVPFSFKSDLAPRGAYGI